MKSKLKTLRKALAPVASGATIGIGGSLLRRQPNAAIRQIIANKVRDLTVMTWAATTAVDMLAAAKAIRRYEGIYVGMFSYGLAPNFRRAVEAGEIEVRDYSETAMVARLRAAAQGVPFLPIRTLFGSDIANKNPEGIRNISCPFTGDVLQAITAAEPEFTIIHGYSGDEYGNIQWPVVRDTDDMDQPFAAGAKRLIVTVEKIVPHAEIKRQPSLTYIPGHWVEAVVEAPYGAHPAACDTFYDEDDEHLKDFLERSRTAAGAMGYLQEFAHSIPDHEAYLRKVGGVEKLKALNVSEDV